MRFKRLRIPAFGPFTDLELEFPLRDIDLHVIYGENEAGKSSLLRAIRDLLFGIHGQSRDNFLHDYKKLRILGEIANRAGDELTFQRRKGHKNTLLDNEGNALPDRALVPFLGSVDGAHFSTMFGLGHRELREGAQELLLGKGEIGKALFSASMGGTPIQQILDALMEESGRLFKGRATANVSIRPAVNRYKELLRESRNSMVNPDTWATLEKELAEQDSTKRKLEEEISKLDGELDWITRCEDALPTVGRLTEQAQRREEIPTLPDVANDFMQRARSSRQLSQQTKGTVETLSTRIVQLEVELNDCPTAPQVMEQANALETLHRNLGAYQTRKESLVDLQGKLAGIKPVIEAGMKSLELIGTFESLEELRLTSALRLSCKEAAGQFTEALRKHDEASTKTDDLNQQIGSLTAQLASMPELNLTPLREALAVAAEATEAHKTLAAGDAEIEKLIMETKDRLGMVPGAPADLDAAAALEVPSVATIRKYAKQIEELDRELRTTRQQIRDENKAVKALEAELSRLERRGELPSEDLLKKVREHRNHGWQLVLADWKGGGAPEELEPGSLLEEAFPNAIVKADEVADQLRLHAEAVAQAEEKRHQIRNRGKMIEEAEQTVVSLDRSLGECQKRWTQEWAQCEIEPRSPAEMEDWRETWVDYRDSLKRLREAERIQKSKAGKVEKAKEVLASVLGDSKKKDFAVLYEAARIQVADGEQMEGGRKEIAKQLGTLGKQREITHLSIGGLVKAVEATTDAAQALYRDAQLALRAAVGTRPLDGLLTDKEAVGSTVREALAARAATFGVTVLGVGLRDIVLPGDMKTILNQVITAQKEAEANLIRRREETAAARSQANTAKLLAENPILARMKELELLQEVLAGAKTSFVFGQGDLIKQVRGLVQDADGTE